MENEHATHASAIEASVKAAVAAGVPWKSILAGLLQQFGPMAIAYITPLLGQWLQNAVDWLRTDNTPAPAPTPGPTA